MVFYNAYELTKNSHCLFGNMTCGQGGERQKGGIEKFSNMDFADQLRIQCIFNWYYYTFRVINKSRFHSFMFA